MVATYSAHSQAEIEEILAHSATAFAEWRRTSVADRALLMTRAAEILESEVPVVAELMTSEMGKTFAAAKG